MGSRRSVRVRFHSVPEMRKKTTMISSKERIPTMKSKIICLTVLALTFAARAEVVEDIKENVRDNWRKIQ